MGLSMVLHSNCVDAALRKPRGIVESTTISEKKDARVLLKRHVLEAIKQLKPLDQQKEFLKDIANDNDDLLDFLESYECKTFRDDLGKAAEMAFSDDFDDDSKIQYVCNDIQRQETILAAKKVYEDVDNFVDGSHLTCEQAYEKKLFNEMKLYGDKKAFQLYSSFETCKEEMSNALEIIHDGRRALIEVVSGGGRELLLVCTVFVILYALLQIGMFVYGIYTWFADDDD